MKTLTRDADSLSHFKRDTDRVVQKLKRTGKPLVLTVKGHAELVVQDAGAYSELLDAFERAETLAGIKLGLASMERGEGIPFDAAIKWLRKRAPDAAVKWFNGFVEALQELNAAPESFGLAPDMHDVPYPIRQLLYGKRQHKYRAFFTIVGDEVHVLHIRHGARRTWRPKNLPSLGRPPDRE